MSARAPETSAAGRLAAQVAALAARLTRSRHGTILCYHGVDRLPPSTPGSPHVSETRFRATIGVAQSLAEAVPLGELVARWTARRSTAGLFAVTFDDAYLSLASGEVLASVEAGLPVCVFVVSGASDRGTSFWWDRLETVLPLVATERWREFLQQIGSPVEYHSSAVEALGSQLSLRQWVLGHHAGRWPSAADAALAALERDTRAPVPDRAMTFDEIDTLVARGRVEIGVHTVSHPVLPLLPDEAVRAELRDCHATLRARWPATLPWVAAPFGLYDSRSHRLALEAGLHGFLSLHRHTLAHATPTHGLPRVNISEGLPRWKLGLMMRGVGALHTRSSARRVAYPALPGRGEVSMPGIEPTIDV